MAKISYPKEIKVFFQDIISETVKSLNPEFILIIGSFGKGEWLYNGDHLLSDFEFVFLKRKKWSIKAKQNLLQRINNRFPYDISMKGYLIENIKKNILSNYTKTPSSYTSLIFFDNFSKPQIIYSKISNGKLPEFSFKPIPNWEAWRLTINRIGDLLSLSESSSSTQKKYYWIKMLEAIVDAYLIVNKKYCKNIEDRYEIFSKQLLMEEGELSIEMIESYDQLKNALEVRKSHQLVNFKYLNNDLYKLIMLWLSYFENKVIEEENLICKEDGDFINIYLEKSILNKKYLESENRFGVIISNLIRFKKHPSLLNKKFKYYNLHDSWRHVSLLSLSGLIKDLDSGSNLFLNMKKPLSKIIKNKYLMDLENKEDYKKIALKYWKILR